MINGDPHAASLSFDGKGVDFSSHLSSASSLVLEGGGDFYEQGESESL